MSRSHPTYSPYRAVTNRVGWALCVMTVMTFIVQLFLMEIDFFAADIPDSRVSFAITTFFETVGYLSMFIIPGLILIVMCRKLSPARIGFSLRMPAWSPLLIVGGITVNMAAAQCNAWLMSAVGFTIPDQLIAPTDYSDPVSIALFITTALAPAFCEEFLFRGVIYNHLRRFGRSQAIVVSALLFSMMHANLAQSFYTFCTGVVLALAYELTGSIWCGTVLHLFNNLYAVLGEIISGRLGAAGYPVLFGMDLILYAAGLVCIVSLIVVLTKGTAKQPSAQSGIFGRNDVLPEISPDDVRPGNLFSAGMIVFTVLTVLTTAMTALVGFGILVPAV